MSQILSELVLQSKSHSFYCSVKHISQTFTSDITPNLDQYTPNERANPQETVT